MRNWIFVDDTGVNGLMGDMAAPILNNPPGSFPHGVLTERNPKLIDQIAAAHPYEDRQLRALAALKAELGGVMRPLAGEAHDARRWAEWGRGHFGTSWADAPFLWSEIYFYRRLLEAVDHFTPGPWQGRDLFGPMKDAELGGAGLESDLTSLDKLQGADAATVTASLLRGAMWGNRADLGFAVTAEIAAEHGGDEHIVVDDTERVLDVLAPGAGLRVGVIADNAGRELCADLLLIDHLLTTGAASAVVLHLKPRPFYVSDATPGDLDACLARMSGVGGLAGEAARRLASARELGALEVAAPGFYTSPFDYRELRDEVTEATSGWDLVILKGDLNYRRLVGDRYWPPVIGFDEVTGYFPGRVLALRTLKSDVLTGIDPALLAELNTTGTRWRTDGTRGMIQLGR